MEFNPPFRIPVLHQGLHILILQVGMSEQLPESCTVHMEFFEWLYAINTIMGPDQFNGFLLSSHKPLPADPR